MQVKTYVGLGDRMKGSSRIMLYIKGKGKNSKTFLLAYSVAKNENKSTWVLDTIYSSHMCGREEMLSKLDRLLI